MSKPANTEPEGAMKPTSHQCAGCGGSGYEHRPESFLSPYQRCPVCLGSGRISDVMPAKDAMADAETLREYLRIRARNEADNFGVNMLFGHPAPETGRYLDIRDGVELCPEHYGLGYAMDANGKRAQYAARAAFRAVPGLRS